jgi:hypothetical protein
MQMKGQLEQQKAASDMQQKQFQSELAARDQVMKQTMEVQANEQKAQMQAMAAKMDAAINVHKQRIFSATEQAKVNQQLVQSEQSHQQKMRHAEEQAKLQKQQTKTSSKSGKPTR